MENTGYKMLTPKEAKGLLEKDDNAVIFDVRSYEEYKDGHIKNALSMPDDEIVRRVPTEISDKDSKIFVYCRSGRRSKKAAELLSDMGYKNVYEFGGILDWPYEIEQ